MNSPRTLTIISILAALLFTAHNLFFVYVDKKYREQHSSHQYKVTFINNLDRGYVWINHNVNVQIWAEKSDASYEPEELISGTLDLSATNSHSGYILSNGKTALGTLTLPAEFQLNRYVRNGNKIVFSVHLLKNDIYDGSERFRPSPQQDFGAAVFTIETRVNPEFSEVVLNYPSGS
jgi:hypothetical protein